MEFTQSLLPRLLVATIHKVPEAAVGDKASRLQALAPPIGELFTHAKIRWRPSGAFEVYEPSSGQGACACHDFVIFSGTLTKDDNGSESWGLCLHHKHGSDFPTLSLYLLPSPTMSHLTQFRTFFKEVLRCLGSPAHLSFVHLEKLNSKRWKVVSLKYSNGISSPVPKLFYKTVMAL